MLMCLRECKVQKKPVPVAARSKAARLLGLWVRIPPGGMDVCRECFVLASRGLCEGLITRPEESYRPWCIWVWSRILDSQEVLAYQGLLRHGKRTYPMWMAKYSCWLINQSGTQTGAVGQVVSNKVRFLTQKKISIAPEFLLVNLMVRNYRLSILTDFLLVCTNFAAFRKKVRVMVCDMRLWCVIWSYGVWYEVMACHLW